MEKETEEFDIAVIGGGPGGYPAAIKAAQLGKKVALIEARELGGTCLNRGCIPSKTLIASAEMITTIKNAKNFGIKVGEVSIDFAKLIERKNRVVSDVRKNLEKLILSNHITLFQGFGKFLSPKTIQISGKTNSTIRADKVIIATGSEPKSIPAFPFDFEKIHDSTSLLEITTLPKSIAIIGAGIVGCEFASLFQILGSQVTLIEMMPAILPAECQTVTSALTKAFQAKGIRIETSVAVQAIEKTDTGIKVKVGGKEDILADIALVAVGRELNTSRIGLKEAGVDILENGIIKVDDQMETSVPGIYAVGDIASKWWLAHVASHQGLVAASNACGHLAKMHYNAIPSVIFTEPEIGTVGLSLEEATKEGFAATIGAFPFYALGKSQASFQTEGFAQIVIDKNTGQILGAQVIGKDASTLIAEMGVAISCELTVESIAETIHAHPTVAEVWLEAALVANNTPLHILKKS